jgi:hypothetical protein
MSTNIIKYNDNYLPYPTPLVTLDRENIYLNQYWGNSDSISLNGIITGNFDRIKTGQSGILNIFNKNFGNFEIYEATGATGFNLNRSGTFFPFSPYFNNLTGVYVPKNSTIIVKISGSYGGFPIFFYRGTSSNFYLSPLSLLKINYYSGASETVFPQPTPYTGFSTTASQSIPSDDKYIDPNFNAKGIYSGNIGNYNYISFANFAGGGGGTPIVRLEVNSFDAEKIYENSGIIVRSINFEESNYSNLIRYEIGLGSTSLSGNVTNPTNEYSFTENEDKTISLSHRVSAQGINTNLSSGKSNAMDNAIAFVRSYTGLSNLPSTRFISGASNKFFMQNFSESIDRLNGVYSVEESYISNLLNTGLSGNLSYTVDIVSGADSNSIQINLRGEYKGPKDGNIINLRNSLNVTGLITGAYSGYFNPVPIQYNISENTGQNLINFDYSFDNINLPNPYYRYETSISRDEVQQLYNVQVRGEIVARGNRRYRYFLSTGNITSLTGQFLSVASGVLTGFKDFNADTTSSNLRLLNINIERNPNEGTVSANAIYDDKFMPSGNFVDANYDVSVNGPVWFMNNQPTCNIKGFHIINDFDITTLPRLNVNTSFRYKNLTGINNENLLRSQVKDITNNILPNNYNFNVQLQDSESYSKKYNSINSLLEISYNLEKIDISNQNGLLPKFNTIN